MAGTSRPSARGGVRGTGDKKTMELAAQLYKKVVDNFNAGGVREVRVPAHREGGLADASTRSSTRWRTCSTSRRTGRSAVPRSTRSSPRTRTAPEAAEAAYAAVLCYQNMYDRDVQGRLGQEGHRNLGPTGADEKEREAKKGEWEKFKPKDFTDSQKGMVTAFNRYVCYIKPAAGRQGSRGAVRRGEVRPRAHLLRGAALGGGGARVPRRRA